VMAHTAIYQVSIPVSPTLILTKQKENNMTDKNIVTVEIDVNDLILKKDRVQVLEQAIRNNINVSSFVRNVAEDMVKKYLSEAVTKELSDKIEALILKNYGTEKQLESFILKNSYSVNQQIIKIMQNKSSILESAIMKSMLEDGFQSKVAEQVRNTLESQILKSIKSNNNNCCECECDYDE